MYERQDGSSLEIGSYAHRPMLLDPDEIPSLEEAELFPRSSRSRPMTSRGRWRMPAS